PSVALSAVTQPRMPISPPLLPTSTFRLTTIDAMVSVSPRLMSPSVLFQISLPLAASTAIVWLSSVLMKTLPSAYAAPRLTVSQQATPCDAAAGFGLNVHFIGAPGCVRSSAYRMLGYG